MVNYGTRPYCGRTVVMAWVPIGGVVPAIVREGRKFRQNYTEMGVYTLIQYTAHCKLCTEVLRQGISDHF
jgi:hypothetical protein